MNKKKDHSLIEEAYKETQSSNKSLSGINRVDNFQNGKWFAGLGFAPIEVLAISVVLIIAIALSIVDENYVRLLFLLPWLLPFWFLALLRTRKYYEIKKQSKLSNAKRAKERKRKSPKRRKDYGRD